MCLYENERIKVFPDTDVEAYIRYFRNQGYLCQLEGDELVIGKRVRLTYKSTKLGKLIYDKRNAKQIPRGKFADMLGVTVDTVFKWEIGQRKPFDYNLNHIIEILEITEEELKECQI